MIIGSYQEKIESIRALSQVMELGSRSNLSNDESEENILSNLITIEGYEQISLDGVGCKYKAFQCNGHGNGLKLTTDGFILTACHNIKDYREEWQAECENRSINPNAHLPSSRTKYIMVDQKRGMYPIDPTVFTAFPELDIAIIKAVIPEKPEPIRFKIADENPELGNELKLSALRDNKCILQYGRVISPKYSPNVKSHKGDVGSIDDTFLTDAKAIPGFSGGIFTNLRGELEGMCLYTYGPNEMGFAGGAKIKNIASLVREFVHNLS